jgi:hypothetical protein
MAKHTVNLHHCIQFYDTTILTKKSGYVKCTIREVTKTELYPESMNRKEGFPLSKSWKPFIPLDSILLYTNPFQDIYSYASSFDPP